MAVVEGAATKAIFYLFDNIPYVCFSISLEKWAISQRIERKSPLRLISTALGQDFGSEADHGKPMSLFVIHANPEARHLPGEKCGT